MQSISLKSSRRRERNKLFVEREGIQIKIEPNYTLRGSLFSPIVKTISKSVAETFKVAIECLCLTEADLLGGKICAALDRQHPRDLFDIKLFLDRGNWDRKVTDAFIFYLISHNRPIHELLNPNFLPIHKSFAEEFEGMTFVQTKVDELENARVALVEELKKRLNESDKRFLVSVATGNPIWNLFFDSKIQEWPSIKWKLLNIRKMDSSKRERQVKELMNFFGLAGITTVS